MEQATTGSQPQDSSVDVFSLITNKFIALLEKGVVPWHKPWTTAGLPQNPSNKKYFRGLNILLLASLGYEHNLFLSFKQVKDIGGKVKRDEKGQEVMFWDYGGRPAAGEVESQENDTSKKKGTLKYYTVYNIAQCTDIPEKYLPGKNSEVLKPTATIEEVLDLMPLKPTIQHKEQKAYYDPLKDIINMPKMNGFKTPELYYSALFHQLIHSTGHLKRLHREGLIEMAEFDSDPFSHEELVAELGSSFLQSHTGITQPVKDGTTLIDGWLLKLRSDKRFIISAASQAQKAVDFILNVKSEELKG